MDPNRILITALLLFTVLLFLACDTDPGLEPTQSGISGTIVFLGDWPENTDEVTVVAATKFPPSTLEEIVLSEPLPMGQDTIDYVIYHPPLDFAAVGLVWKEKGQPWDITNIIGIYFPPDATNLYSPGSVSIPDKHSIVDSINFIADFSKAKRAVDSEIRGTLHVNGEWPANTSTLILLASTDVLPSWLMSFSFSNPLPVGFDSLDYTFNVQPGVYNFLGALVIQDGEPITLESLRALYFENPLQILLGQVEPIRVRTDTSIVKHVDMTLNFD